MAGRAGDILVRFLGDDKDLIKSQRNVRQELDQTDSRLGKVKGSFASAGSAIKGLFATVVAGAVARVGAELVELGRKAEATRRRFGIVFGEMAADVEAWADQSNESFGLGQLAVQDMAAQVQDLLVPLGFLRSEAADLTKEVLTSAAALSQWTGGAVTVEDAAERIRKAMLGEREGLEALGIKILESNVQQRLLEKGQKDLIGNELERAKVLATLELIQEKSTDAMGAYTDQTDKAAVAQRELTAAYEDARQELGDKAYDLWANSVINARDALHGANKELLLSQLGLIQFIPGVREMIRAWDDATIAQYNTRQASIDYHNALDAGRHRRREVVDDTEDYAQAAQDAATAIRGQITATRELTDPAFRLVQTYDRFQEAFEKVLRLEAEGKTATEEYNRAIGVLLDTTLEHDAAQAGFADSADLSIEALEALGRSIGLREADLQRFIDLIREANGLTIAPGIGGSGGGGGRAFQTGGVVPGPRGKPQVAIVHGGEEVLTPQQRRARNTGSDVQTIRASLPDQDIRQRRRDLFHAKQSPIYVVADYTDPNAARRTAIEIAREQKRLTREKVN